MAVGPFLFTCSGGRTRRRGYAREEPCAAARIYNDMVRAARCGLRVLGMTTKNMEFPLPAGVTISEVGPRDGFQYESALIPTDLKLETIRSLAAAGVGRIQITSFVHPQWVPQMADAEEVAAALSDVNGVTFSGLVLNRRGVDRALHAGLTAIDISIAMWDEHSLDNANMTADEAVEQAVDMVATARTAGADVQMGFQTVFGFREPGDTPLDRVVRLAGRFADLGVHSISLADTTGLANPKMVAERVQAVQAAVGSVPIALHLHDTRGLGLANVYEALQRGVTWFDAALGGMGGCPFIKGAAGNIATEDVVYLLESLGIDTGIDIERVSQATRRLAAYLKRTFPGKIYRLGG